jgi:predicted O-methyltransferase YrrM
MLKINLTYEKLRRLFLSIRYGFIIPNYDGMLDETQCKFLYEIVKRYSGKKTVIVEIGSYKGSSTTWLAVAGKRYGFQSLIAIDLFTGTPYWKTKFNSYEAFMIRMKRNKLESFVIPIKGDSREVIKKWDRKKTIAILHIDGDHSYEGVKADIDNYIPYLEHHGIIIFDDYVSTHPNVKRAVHELLNTMNFQVHKCCEEIKEGFGSIALKKIN